MENLKLISARINPETLEKLNAIAGSNRFFNRNAVINGILTAVINNTDRHSIEEMVIYDPRIFVGSKIEFEHTWKEKKT